MNDDIIEAPKCFSFDGKHNIEKTDSPYWGQCTYCFERFILVSETVAKNAGIKFVVSRKP